MVVCTCVGCRLCGMCRLQLVWIGIARPQKEKKWGWLMFGVMFFWNVKIIHSSLQDLWPSLMLACENGHAEVVRILVSAGAHVKDQNEVSSTSHWQPSSQSPMTLGDLYPNVKLYSELATYVHVDGGLGGHVGRWKGERE